MKSDPRNAMRFGPLEPGPVAGTPARGPGALRRFAGLAVLVALILGLLAAASLAAALRVRAGAPLRLGLDPLLPERARPRLSLHELALRGVAADVLRQVLLALCVLALARLSAGSGWFRRLALARPAGGRPPILRSAWFWLALLAWPLVHIAWVSGTARLLHVGFGQGVRLSPFLTPALVGWWLAYVVLLAPVAEELLIRGEAFARAGRITGPFGTIVLTALLFCLLHLTDAGLARPVTLIPLALALGWLRGRTGSLWPCILLHAWSNAALVGFVLWPKS